MPGNHEHVGTEQIGDFQDLALPGLLAEGFDLGPLQAEDRDHAAGRGIGGLLHCGAPLLHHHQALVEIHDAGEDHGGILAQAQSGRRFAREHDVGRLLAQRFQGGQAGDEQGGLTIDRGIEDFGRPLEAEFGQIVAEKLLGAIVQPPRSGERFGQPPAHAHGLGPLSWKQKGDLAQRKPLREMPVMRDIGWTDALRLRTRRRRPCDPCNDRTWGRRCAEAPRNCTAHSRSCAAALSCRGWHGGYWCGRWNVGVLERP